MNKLLIKDKLKQLRLDCQLTADEVGNMIGKSGKTVNGWENGRSQPDVETFLKLCDIYKVNDIFTEFNVKDLFADNKNNFLLSEHEKQVITAYRARPEMQNAVDTLLNVPSLIEVKSVARSSDYHKPYKETITAEQLELLQSQEQPSSDDDL